MLHASIGDFESQLIQSLEAEDWAAADRAADRLKTLLLTATIDADADAIARITSILAAAGERVELRHRLRLRGCDATGAAWKLRSDAGTGVLAMRLRPLEPAVPDEQAYEALADTIVRTLRDANRPMNNKQIARRLERDEPIISRTLKRLVARGRVRQWKQGARLFNALVETRRPEPIEAMRRSRAAVEKPHYGYVHVKPDSVFNADVTIAGFIDAKSFDDYVKKQPFGPEEEGDAMAIPGEMLTAFANFEQVKYARNR